MKLQFSQHILNKISNVKFYKNSSSGGRLVPCGQTDKLDEAILRTRLKREMYRKDFKEGRKEEMI